MSKKNRSRREQKRQQFVKAAQEGRPRLLRWAIPLAILVLVLLVGAGIWFYRGGNTGGAKGEPKVIAIKMKDIKVEVTGGKIIVPLSTIKRDRLVYFEYKDKSSRTVPLLAYVGPSGKIITATSVCEPCRSTRFHIEGDTLICNTCGTVWNLETHEGVSGGCTAFPPQIIVNQVKGDKVLIDEDAVAKWKPRASKPGKDATG